MIWIFASAAHADVTEDVRCREIAFSRSVETQDLAKFKSFIDNDARFAGNSVSKGPAAIADAWMVVFDAGSLANKAPPDEVQALLEQEEPCD